MSTNMTMSPKYSYLWINNIDDAKVKDRICNWSKLIF